MSLPLFDAINLPPNTVLVDINSIANSDTRQRYQGDALALFVEEENGGDWDVDRDWDDNEGAFLVVEDGTPIGIAIVFDVEDL